MRRLALDEAPRASRVKALLTARLSARHDSLREGTALGVIVATGIWLWLALIDALAGQPFHTFSVLGGITTFTIAHYLLNIVYGIVVVSAIHAATREPSTAIALVFGIVTLEIAFGMLTILLSHLGLGARAWLGIFGGSLIGTGLALFVLSRQHPLVTLVRDADSDHDLG